MPIGVLSMDRRRRDVQCSLMDGIMAGFVGTAAMTLAMESLFRRLPRKERYPLPPRQITEATAETVGMNRRLNESSRVRLTLALHFGYGSTVGALYWLSLRFAGAASPETIDSSIHERFSYSKQFRTLRPL
jgi:hypothetical protein